MWPPQWVRRFEGREVQVGIDPQQVLDALDPEQREVATSSGAPTVVIAGAGTGKTRALTHRIAYAALTGVLDPRRTLAVTFTTRAAGELRARLAALGVPQVQARTFHSAALRQNRYFWPRAYGVDLPQVTDSRIRLVAEASNRHRLGADTALLRDLAGEISWAKVSNVPVGDYPALARAAGREFTKADPEAVARVFATYEQLKTARGLIDFDDVLLCNAALLSQHPDIAAEVHATYAHFVVDEFQDVSPLQHTVLNLWLGGRHDVCVVGDPNQSIHAFAGARPDYLLTFSAEHPGARTVRLVRNYRSTPEVLVLANRVVAPVNAGVRLEARRPSGVAPEFAAAESEADEAAGIAEWLAGVHRDGVEWREMAVLFRISAQSPALEAALAERDVPYQVRGAERFYERPEIRQAMLALRAAAGTGHATTGAAVDDESVAVARVREVLLASGWTPEPPSGAGHQRERWESLAALLDAAQSVADEDADLDFASVVAVLQHRASIDHAPAGAGVTLATMHSAKGLEWDAVALAGVHEGTMPFVLATSAADLAEERRLLHVAVTRARSRLRISWSGSRGRVPRPSRFLDGCLPAGLAGSDAGTSRRPRAARGVTACRVCGGVLSTAADRKLGRHEDCPSSYDEALLAGLKAWRKQSADDEHVPAFVVFTDATLIAIAEALPRTRTSLLAIPGVGRRKAERYGDEVLALVERASG